MNIAIEYQGEQHTLEIGFFGGREGLARTRERDERKRALCEANGVRLIEIHFNDDLRDDWIQRQILQQLPAADRRVIRSCPRCGMNLRLPAGKSGMVRCQSCHQPFRAET